MLKQLMIICVTLKAYENKTSSIMHHIKWLALIMVVLLTVKVLKQSAQSYQIYYVKPEAGNNCCTE